MEKIIAEKFGCRIIERDSKFFVQYDNGQAASWIVENEITAEEVDRVTLNEENTYKIILEAERRSKPKRVI